MGIDLSKKRQNRADEPEVVEEKDDVEEVSAKNGIDEIWKFFASMKLGLILLLIIAVASIVGTLLPPDPQTGLPKFNIYQQIWYRALLGLLCMNLLVCSLNRWGFITRSLKDQKPKVSETFIKRLSNYTSIRKKVTLDDAEKSLTEAFGSKGYKVNTERSEGIVHVVADKGRIGVLGSFITHLSFIIITLGAIYGNFSGWESFTGIPEGQTIDLKRDLQDAKISDDENFQLKVNRFWIDYTPEGYVSHYYSDLSVIENNQEVKRETIWVNNPLEYNGIKLYQSSYGAMTQIKVKVTNKANGESTEALVYEQDGIQVPGTGLFVRPIKFIPDYDPNNPMQSKSNVPNNPAVIYSISRDGQQVEMNTKMLNSPIELEEGTIEFTGFNQGHYTGLSVRKDPGVPTVWFGSVLMMVGMSISYAYQHRKIYASIKEANGVAIIDMGGITDKNKYGLEEDFNSIVERTQE